jgi:hypothetical protein
VNRLSPERQIRYARILGLAFCVAGFAAIAIGWNGAARRAYVDTQFPYLISGGLAGIGLLVFGIGLLVVAQIRAERMRLTTVMDLLGERLTRQARAALQEASAEREPKEAEPFVFQVRYARILAIMFAVAGFTAIALGWNGAARFAYVDQQFPYLLSGGVGGIALILVGVGILMIAQIRTDRRKLMNVLEVMAVAVRKSASPEAQMPAEAAEVSAGTNGWVIAGPSTYHRPGCRLVHGKDLDRITVGSAQASGLSPCRVCKPELPDAVAADGEVQPKPQEVGAPSPTAEAATGESAESASVEGQEPATVTARASAEDAEPSVHSPEGRGASS